VHKCAGGASEGAGGETEMMVVEEKIKKNKMDRERREQRSQRRKVATD
jgi:hypothetical protein